MRWFRVGKGLVSVDLGLGDGLLRAGSGLLRRLVWDVFRRLMVGLGWVRDSLVLA